MAQAGNRIRIVSGAAGLVLLGVLAWAWIDAGREPVRDMAEPVILPGMPR